MPRVSVVVPVYNVESYLSACLESILSQTFSDFELLVVDDGSTDGSVALVEAIVDPRLRLIRQENRGLAGARNTGIRHAEGEFIALLDSDDLWLPQKLERHVAHLDSRPEVGLSFSRSAFINETGQPLNYYQMPKLTEIDAPHLLCRNPVGNGSAPVLRRQALEGIRFSHPVRADACWFDEDLRQSEDIECWIRLVATTSWRLEGIPEALTLYRVNTTSLSTNLLKQLETWECGIAKVESYAPDLVRQHGSRARAYQLRYLARRAVQLRQGAIAKDLYNQALATDPSILWQEPRRTILTGLAATLLATSPSTYQQMERFGMRLVGKLQELKIKRTPSVLTSRPAVTLPGI